MPSSFEILKFPGGITIIPKLSPQPWMLPEVLFNFTLRNSLQDIEENFLELKVQLKSGLQLMPYESIFVQVTNKAGSTIDPPVTVQASVVSTLGGLDPQRLKELALKNHADLHLKKTPLGLDNACLRSVSVPRHHALPPRASTSPPPRSEMPPNLSPLPAVSYGSRPHQDNGYQKGLAPSPHSVLPSSSSSKTGVLYRIICPFFFIILITLHIL
ncbi:hypothetical protein Tco_1365539 [Tanacetum coccineum]